MRRTTDLARWSLVSGVLGVIANVLLIAFYALAQPWKAGVQPFEWVGSVNDFFVLVQYATLLPVGLGLRSALQRHRLGWVAWLGIGAMALIVLLQALLLLRVMKFSVEGILVSLCIAASFGWLLALVQIGKREDGAFTGRLATFGTAIVVGIVLGLVLVGLALVLPKGSLPQYVLFGVGGAFGSFGWLGFPFWLIWARNRLSQLGGVTAQPYDGPRRRTAHRGPPAPD